jgi:hypothetical protein
MLDGLRKWPLDMCPLPPCEPPRDRPPQGDGGGRGGPLPPAVVDSRIDGEFEGWQGETVFKLINGQYWQQVSFSYVYHYAFGPAVQIAPDGASHRMFVEEVDRSILVRLIDVEVDTVIAGDFTGWEGGRHFELANGQLWRQVDDACADHYAYRPRAIIYRDASEHRMFVDGVGVTVAVQLVRG